MSSSSRAEHVVALLRESSTYRDPNPGRDKISGTLHALRVGGIMQVLHGDEAGFVGLVHDLARPLNDVHHGEVIAEIVRDRVSPEAYEALYDHGTMQSIYLRDGKIADAAATELDVALCKAEIESFRPGYDGPSYSMSDAERIIRRVLRD